MFLKHAVLSERYFKFGCLKIIYIKKWNQLNAKFHSYSSLSEKERPEKYRVGYSQTTIGLGVWSPIEELEKGLKELKEF